MCLLLNLKYLYECLYFMNKIQAKPNFLWPYKFLAIISQTRCLYTSLSIKQQKLFNFFYQLLNIHFKENENKTFIWLTLISHCAQKNKINFIKMLLQTWLERIEENWTPFPGPTHMMDAWCGYVCLGLYEYNV